MESIVFLTSQCARQTCILSSHGYIPHAPLFVSITAIKSNLLAQMGRFYLGERRNNSPKFTSSNRSILSRVETKLFAPWCVFLLSSIVANIPTIYVWRPEVFARHHRLANLGCTFSCPALSAGLSLTVKLGPLIFWKSSLWPWFMCCWRIRFMASISSVVVSGRTDETKLVSD